MSGYLYEAANDQCGCLNNSYAVNSHLYIYYADGFLSCSLSLKDGSPHQSVAPMDCNGDGELSLTEFIVALRGHPEVSAVLKLPHVIRQEDGSRDLCVSAFNDMDDDNSNFVDILMNNCNC